MTIARSLRALVKSNDRRFVSLLCEQADLTLKSLQVLEQLGSQPTDHEGLLQKVKEIERAGDEKRRILIAELVRTYATPFDREDLFALSRSIDDILDAANETAVELAMYRIAVPEYLPEMASVLVEGARHIRTAVADLLEHPEI
jgi:predicted phosphate transport protein (TIGR00153 family)